MEYSIGMDFGTTNSTVAFMENGKPAAYKFPPVEGQEYIPSCVAYDDTGISVGRAAMDCIEDEKAIYCSNLKMILPMDNGEAAGFDWTRKKSPESAIADYFREILLKPDKECGSFVTEKGPISGIVVSVPHVWDSMHHPGRKRLQDILKKDLGLPLIQLISEPVAAAAYFAWKHRKDNRPFTGNLLICDMGGGTFDVTLCRVEPGQVVEIHNDGNGRKSMGKAGFRFDRNLIMNGFKKNGADFRENGQVFFEYYRKLQEYKANRHPAITKQIINAMDDPDLRETTVILRAGKLGFTFTDIREAFAEVARGIEAVLNRFVQAIDGMNETIDEVFFVGGFGQFHLVREHILKTLGSRFHIGEANRESTRFAIAYGTALIANEQFAVEQKYNHSMGIMGWVGEDDGNGYFRQKDQKIFIIKGGDKLSAYEKPGFAPNDIRIHHDIPKITIWVDLGGKTYVKDLPDDFGIRLPDPGNPDKRFWRVGMRINRSKVVYLVFRSNDGTDVEFELGDIVRKMFGRPEIIPGGTD